MSRDNPPIVAEIQQLIADEEDKKTRALLMILQQLSASHFDSNGIVANLVNEVKQQRVAFESHCETERQLLAQTKGGQIVAKYMLSFVCALLLVIQGLVVYEFNIYKEMIFTSSEQSKKNATDIEVLQRTEALK